MKMNILMTIIIALASTGAKAATCVELTKSVAQLECALLDAKISRGLVNDQEAKAYAARINGLHKKWTSLVNTMLNQKCSYTRTVVRDSSGQNFVNPAMAEYCE